MLVRTYREYIGCNFDAKQKSLEKKKLVSPVDRKWFGWVKSTLPFGHANDIGGYYIYRHLFETGVFRSFPFVRRNFDHSSYRF